jgi:hypothetical protein
MLNEFRHECRPRWDIEKIHRCCPEPPPTHPEPPCNPDCCYDAWNWELIQVNIKLKDVGCELADAQKHLTVVTTRFNRLKAWHEELTKANELTFAICRQLKLIEGQLESICKNTCYTVNAVEILYCMIREFYYTLDCLWEKYDRIMNCIKNLQYPSLNTTSGIGKVLSDYGTALTAVTGTRDALIALMMKVVDGALKLHDELCDDCGYQLLISHCRESFHCGIPCGEPEHHPHPIPLPASQPGYGPQQPGYAPPEPVAEEFCLAPMLRFPICNDPYYQLIADLYREEKLVVDQLTEQVNDLTKEQVTLTAIQQSLIKALKEVTPS